MKNFFSQENLVIALITTLGFALRFWQDANVPLLTLASSLSVPLAFVAARAWAGSSRIGMFAAIFMALMPAAIHFGSISIAHAAAPALVWWSVLITTDESERTRANKPDFYKKPGLSALLLLVPALLAVLMDGVEHLVLRWPDGGSLWRGLAALSLADRAGEISIMMLGLVVTSALLGCVATRIIHQKEFAVKRCGLHPQDLGLPAMMIACTLIASATLISPLGFDGATMVVATPALAMLLAWSFEALILEPRAQLPGPPTPETQSQRYGLVAIASLALLAVYWRTFLS